MSVITRTSRRLLASKHITITSKRFSTRESIHRHVEPDKVKKHILAATEPYFVRKYQRPEETCKGTGGSAKDLLPLEKILTEELLEDIDKSEFILFIQYNYTQFQSERVYKNTLTKSGGKFHALNNMIYREAFKTLDREELCHFFIARNALLTGQVDNLPACVIALRKMPQFILLAGCINMHLYNLDQLKSIAKTNNIDRCRADLVSLLETPAVDLSSYLQQHGENIVDSEVDK